MNKLFKNQSGFSHHFLLPVLVIVAISGIGTYVLQRSRAASTPYDDVGQAALMKKNGNNKDFAGLSSVRLVKKDANHPCRGMFEIAKQDHKAPDLCTHGPDKSPPSETKGKIYNPEDIKKKAANIQVVSEEKAASSYASGEYSYTNIRPAIAAKCYGNGTDGFRVQMVYAYKTRDNYDAYAPYLRLFAGAMDNVVFTSSLYSGSGSSARRIRFVQSPSTCKPTILKVHMPNYDRNKDNVTNFIKAAPLTVFNKTTKYMIWVDEPNNRGGCGYATAEQDSNPNFFANKAVNQVGFATVPPECWNANETHELFHTFGAVANEAPHTTGYNHCYDGYDVMCYDDGGTFPVNSYVCENPDYHWVLDCNKNDYFSTSTSIPRTNYLSNHWNTANSPQLGR